MVCAGMTHSWIVLGGALCATLVFSFQWDRAVRQGVTPLLLGEPVALDLLWDKYVHSFVSPPLVHVSFLVGPTWLSPPSGALWPLQPLCCSITFGLGRWAGGLKHFALSSVWRGLSV